MSSPRACCHVTLARNAIAHIEHCTECGCVSVHLGPMTVRLDAEGLEALGAVLGQATVELHVQRVAENAVTTTRGLA